MGRNSNSIVQSCSLNVASCMSLDDKSWEDSYFFNLLRDEKPLNSFARLKAKVLNFPFLHLGIKEKV